jgi:alanine-glyoxylate transaminase/serine-glyoxylate transaminase/serine-pyruvate transaminase
MNQIPKSLSPTARVLMGPGPSPTAPSVYEALSKPTLGHLDPEFILIMDEIRDMQRAVMGTQNELTMPMSGTGSSGMETCFVNLIQPGDKVLVGVNGVFGTRMVDVARRCGAKVTEAQGEWGRALDPELLREAANGEPHHLVCVVHAETSTGVLQEVGPVKEVADELGAMLLLDCVTSVGGLRVSLDEWGVDAAYSGTQKCLGCPPGLSPVSLSARAQGALEAREHAVQSWYLDLSMIANYWGSERAYHHTAPINMLYGLHEALRLVLEEGIDERERRHRLHSAALVTGLEAMGLTPRVPEAERLPPLTAVSVPDGVDDAAVRTHLLEHHNLEIGGGLGPMKGNTWRIGLMGAGACRENVELCLRALHDAMDAQGSTPAGDGVTAAQGVYAE